MAEVATKPCAHHWELETPSKASHGIVIGRCSLCKGERKFPASEGAGIDVDSTITYPDKETVNDKNDKPVRKQRSSMELNSRKDEIIAIWERNGGNALRTAKEIGIPHTTLFYNLQRWGLTKDKPNMVAKLEELKTKIESERKSILEELGRLENQIDSLNTVILLLKNVTNRPGLRDK